MSTSKDSANPSILELGMNFVSIICAELEQCKTRIFVLEKIVGLSNKHQSETKLHQVENIGPSGGEKRIPTSNVKQKRVKLEKGPINNPLPLVLISPNIPSFRHNSRTKVIAPITVANALGDQQEIQIEYENLTHMMISWMHRNGKLWPNFLKVRNSILHLWD
ncbi:unnamed protein product [Calypogeia fissa]